MHYLIKQRYLYWRENSCGYSERLGNAGIYDDKTAKGIQRGRREPPDVLVLLDINIREDIEEELAECRRMINNLTKMLDFIRDEEN